MSYGHSPSRVYATRDGPIHVQPGIYREGGNTRFMRDEYSYHEELTSGPPVSRRDVQLQETDILGDDSDAECEEEREMIQRDRGVSDDLGAGSSSEDESEDPEFLELQERERIIQMYDKGPDNVEIDSWENPDFDLYKKMDRFGFVHRESTRPSQSDIDRKRVERELKREKKWLSMLNQWRDRKPVKKLEERIWKGIPEKLRIMVWPKLLGVEELKRECRSENVYSELLVRARLVSKDIKQIDLDINRTYRDHLAFRRRYDVKQQSLLNVLAAYSMYNTEVGYCQGMSQIAALFLMYLDEEDTFWCMHSLMVGQKHIMHGFFVPGFPKLQRFEAHFKKVLKKYKPRIFKHLDKQDIPYIYLTKWWFGCFLDRVPFSLALRLWDVYLLEGDVILIAMALNIMKMHEKSIRKLQIENFMEFIQSDIANDFGYPDDETMHSLREILTKLRSDRQHHPPPPSQEDLPEQPTKALGPILSRNLADIRADVAEIQSRCSRANSVATGRSPHPRRKGPNGRAPPSPTPRRNGQLVGRAESGSLINRARADTTPNGAMSRTGYPLVAEKEVPFEVPSMRRPSSEARVVSQWPSTPPPDPRQPGSHASTPSGRPGIQMGISGITTPTRPTHPPSHPSSVNKSYTSREYRDSTTPDRQMSRAVPASAGGWEPFSRNRGSLYDNVPNGSGTSMNIRDDQTGKMVSVIRARDNDEYQHHSRTPRGGFGSGNGSGYNSTSGNGAFNVSLSRKGSDARVTHTPNNVTYISVGDDEVQQSVV